MKLLLDTKKKIYSALCNNIKITLKYHTRHVVVESRI